VPEVGIPAYRNYIAARQDANNAMMALLAGSRLAAHTLQLTQGSQRLLPEIFPAVDHIRRFNLQTDRARQLLVDADSHLGAVAVPYALAVHEDFMLQVLNLIKQHGIQLRNDRKAAKAWNMHEIFSRSTGHVFSKQLLSQFHLLRLMRNSQIHTGGQPSPELIKKARSLSAAENTAWERLTGRSATTMVDAAKLTFTSGDIFSAFAVTKRLGRDVNAALQTALAVATWCQIVVEDYAAVASHLPNSDQWLRGLEGYARQFYSPLGLSAPDLEGAARAMGVWTRTHPVPQRRSQR
jgi:hypothetical protein